MTDNPLPPRVDWHGNKREATVAEITRAEGTAARIRREVAEMRAAAERLRDGGDAFDTAVADFLTVEATALERNGGEARYAETLSSDQDTRERHGMLATAARSALLIARAYTEARS
jgi:hypothetical protein